MNTSGSGADSGSGPAYGWLFLPAIVLVIGSGVGLTTPKPSVFIVSLPLSFFLRCATLSVATPLCGDFRCATLSVATPLCGDFCIPIFGGMYFRGRLSLDSCLKLQACSLNFFINFDVSNSSFLSNFKCDFLNTQSV